MKSPSLSIVIPTIGRNVLDQTIESVLNQSELPDEIAIWDNSGSNIVQVQSKYRNNDKIHWFSADVQIPIIDSWNSAVRHTSGEFVYILGDDDLLLPDFVKKVKHELNNDAQLIHVENIFIDEAGNTLNDNKHALEFERISKNKFIKTYSTNNDINIFLSSLVFPRKAFEEIGAFKNIVSNGLAMDVLFNIEILNKCENISMFYSPLWKYRTAVSDWCGAVKSPQTIPFIAKEYLMYRDYVSKFFTGELKNIFSLFCKRRITSQIIGVCYPASAWKTFCLIFDNYFTFREKISMLRDIFYMFRHYRKQ